MIAALWLGCLARCDEGPTAVEPIIPHPAPERRYLGVALGTDPQAAAEAQLTRAGQRCAVKHSAASGTVWTTCTGEAPLPGRALHGPLSEVLLSGPADGPVDQVAASWRYSLPEQALADFDAIVADNRARLGEPERLTSLDLDALASAPNAHAGALWRFGDLVVHVSLLNPGTGTLRLSERWLQPAAPR